MMNYEGKICVVTGAASGMGKATAELLVKAKAKVYAMDINEVTVEGIEKAIIVDLSEKESIDKAMEEIPEKIDCFFAVAGLLGESFTFMKVAKINLISNKYILEEKLIDRFNENGAIAIVASAAAANWQLEENRKYVKPVVDAEGWDGACAAYEATGVTAVNGGLAYVNSKVGVCYLAARLTRIFGEKHIRVNCLLPGYTLTAFGVADGRGVKEDEPSPFAGFSGRTADPKEMAMPLLFLNSNMASYVSGTYIFGDYGATSQIMSGAMPNPLGGTLDTIYSAMGMGIK